MTAPLPVCSAKLSMFGPGQYYGGGPRWNPRCCSFASFNNAIQCLQFPLPAIHFSHPSCLLFFLPICQLPNHNLLYHVFHKLLLNTTQADCVSPQMTAATCHYIFCIIPCTIHSTWSSQGPHSPMLSPSPDQVQYPQLHQSRENIEILPVDFVQAVGHSNLYCWHELVCGW